MRILIVLGGFFPAQTYGGPPVSIDNLCNLLSDEIEFFIITSDHELHQKERLQGIADGWNTRKNCKVQYLHNGEETYKKYYSIVKEVQPDIIYINSLFSAKTTIPYVRIAYKESIPVLLASRGELCVNGFNKKYKKIPYLILFSKYLRASNVWYQSTSDEESTQIQKIMRISSDRILELTNVPTTYSGIHECEKKIPGASKIIFLSRIEPKKNLQYALKLLKYVKSNIQYDIYGTKEDSEYWKTCEELISQLPSNVKVMYCGPLNHDEVADTFAKYDCFLFPTISENYGHVIAESMLSGCPVITSDQVPWHDVMDVDAGWILSLNNPERFVSAVEHISSLNSEELQLLSDKCRKYVENKNDIGECRAKYLKAFNKIALSRE